MKIAEFFVLLGVKGDDKSKKSIGGVVDGLKEAKSTSLEAKAAIIGVIYGLERMMSHSMKTGAGLVQFAKYTGLSADQLQRWQYAAKMASVSNQEVEGSIKNVQSAMTNMLLGKGAPEGMMMLSSTVGFDASKARDTFYVMEKLGEFARKAPKDVGNSILQSFGISEGMITAMRRNAFAAKALADAPVYSEGQIIKLEKINARWSEIGHKMKLAMGQISAEHGVPMMDDIAKAATSIMALTESLVVLAEKVRIFETIGQAIKGWDEIIKSTTGIVDFFTSEKTTVGEKASGIGSFLKDFGGWAIENMGIDQASMNLKIPGQEELLADSARIKGYKQRSGDMAITQYLNFKHDGQDASKLKATVKTASAEAYRQMNQGQEN